ncbi:SGNH/GDSL hydrolase family protein [Roseateles paludis]|jgi:outer membrane lipase/esterase|uniref:SGNH/GDSL hydrolase family protein n=1 Tax=Roseateles paludis TaxID=3145238 RepID=A0ABV0G5Z2_9BURK
MSTLRSVLAAAALATASLTASAYNSVVAFGDSLSDNGNLLSATGGLIPLTGAYWNGRFSNGKVAVEVLAQQLGAPLIDVAFGGAGTGFSNPQFPGTALEPTGIRSQVAGYLSATGGHADANSLYFVWGGPNDFLVALDTPSPNFGSIILGGALNLVSSVDQLYNAGARSFLLPLMPDLGATPRALALDASLPGASTGLSFLSLVFNSALSSVYTAWGAQHPDAHLTLFDTFTRQHVLLAAASGLGMDITTPCYTGGPATPGTLCANPNQHFYWDDIHPSALVHQSLGLQLAAAVPEPSTYALMALGLVGIAVRRARQRSA